MKKISTVLSSAFFAVAAFAGTTTETAPFTIEPSGGTVESLQTFTMTMQPESGVYDLGFASYYIYIEKDGTRVATSNGVSSLPNMQYELMFPAAIVENGEYTLVFPAGSVTKYDSDYNKLWTNETPFEYKYTVEAPAAEEIPFTLTPAPGTTLPIMKSFKLDMVTGGEAAALGFTSNLFKLYRDGQEVRATFSTKQTNEGELPTNFDFYLISPIVEEGDYTIVMPAGTVSWFDSDFMKLGSNTFDYEFNYTIKFDPNVDAIPEFNNTFFSITPNGGKVDKLDTFNIEVGGLGVKIWDITWDNTRYYVTKDGQRVCGVNKPVQVEGPEWTMSLETPQTEPGTYRLIFPVGSVFDSGADTSNQEWYIYEYTIEGQETPGDGQYVNSYITFDPSAVEQTSISGIKMWPKDSDYDYIDLDRRVQPQLLKDGEVLYEKANIEWIQNGDVVEASVLWFVDGNGMAVKEITEPGEYEAVFPVGSLLFYNMTDYTKFMSNEEVVRIKYVISGGTPVEPGNQYITFDPAGGEVAELTYVSMTPKTGYDDISVEKASSIELKKDGVKFASVKPDWLDDGTMCVRFYDAEEKQIEKITEPGEYTLVFPANSLAYYIGWDLISIDEEIVLNYTIVGGTTPVVENKYYTYSPTEEIQTSLTEIELQPKDPYYMLESLDASLIEVLKNGETFCAAKLTDLINPDGTYGLTLKFYDANGTRIPEITEAGEYLVVIPAGAIGWYHNNGEYGEVDVEQTIKYVIEGSATEAPKFKFVPADNESVESLASIEMTLDDSRYTTLNLGDAAITVNKDGEKFCDATATANEDFTAYTITLATPATEAGTYTVAIEGGKITVSDGGNAAVVVEEETLLTYNVTGKLPETVFDATVTKTSPIKLNQTTDFDDIQWEANQFVTFTTNISSVKAKEDVTVTFAAKDGSFSTTAALQVNFGSQLKALFTEKPVYNGDYTITIPKASFGDEAWLANNATGHSNDEIVLNFTFSGLKDQAQAVEFDIVPVSFKPALDQATGDLSSVTITFDQPLGIYGGGELAAVLWSTEQSYRTMSYVSASAPQTEFTFTFNPAPTEAGNYLFMVAKGSLGDADYIANDQTGHATAEISHVYEFNPSLVGILTLDADQVFEDGIFTVEGICVGKTTRNLPAGIYIAGGRKIAIK